MAAVFKKGISNKTVLLTKIRKLNQFINAFINNMELFI